uniref:Ycf80 n=1 Tax=Palisada sp. TaxID=1955416 RepID=A0A1Z1MRE6_9FLOR|nr:hypothetical protein [Palisada sp.]
MILLNLLLTGYHKNDQLLKFELCTEDTKNFSSLLNFRLKDDKLNPIFLSSNKLLANHPGKKYRNSGSIHRLANRNFWQKLINKYWQETIFISLSNSVLDKYINKLRASGFSVYQGSDYKHFLKQFSRDLLERKIQVTAGKYNEKNTDNLIKGNEISIKYRWLKSLNPNALFFKNYKNEFVSNLLINKNSKSFPLFILINDKKQVILAESTDYLRNRLILSKFFRKIIQMSSNSQKLYTGLFFTNLDDAVEYLNYINSKYYKSTRNLKIKIVPTTIDLYYQLLKKSDHDIEFRLIPDLKEISQLLYKYRRYKNVSFDNNQYYGFNYFQGQPLYFFKPYSLNTTKGISHFRYLYSFSENHKVQYEAAFFNYETAINAWQKYRRKFEYYHLPFKPQIHVFNLETFLTTSNYINKHNKFIFIPSLRTYNFAKQYIGNNLDDNLDLIKLFRDYILGFKSLFYRILWSLTTRQPTSR